MTTINEASDPIISTRLQPEEHMARDPIIAPASNASGKPNRPDANRNKSLPGKAPSFVGNGMKGFPAPSNPYGK